VSRIFRAILFVVVSIVALSVGGRVESTGRWDPAIAASRVAVQRIIDAGTAPGVGAAVAVRGEVVWSDGFGLADVDHRTPVTRETRFGVGSISKSFTMAAAMTIVDEGRLDLDAPIERYRPDFPHAGRGITVRRLAVHQSGMDDSFAVAHYDSTAPFPTLDSAYQQIRSEKLLHEPGTAVAYGTGLYTIIGRVMETVDGRPFDELMRRRLFEPAGMRSAVAHNPRIRIPNRTIFYVPGNGASVRPAPPVDPSFKLPGAGYLATAEDVARFGAALLRGTLLSARARKELFTAVPLASRAATEFAPGFRVAEEKGRRLVHQPGGGLGISAWLFVYPDDELVIALTSNIATGPVGGRARREIAEAFFAALRNP
jgi:serine beta-lactamase-like protein LACTB